MPSGNLGRSVLLLGAALRQLDGWPFFDHVKQHSLLSSGRVHWGVRLFALYSMISQMRVVSAPRTVACADKIILTIIDTYFSPNRSMRELRDLIKVGDGIPAEGIQRSGA